MSSGVRASPGNLNLSEQGSNPFTRFLEDQIQTPTTVFHGGPIPKLKPKTFTTMTVEVNTKAGPLQVRAGVGLFARLVCHLRKSDLRMWLHGE